MSTRTVMDHLNEIAQLNEDESAELDDILKTTVQANLAIAAVQALKAAGYRAFLREYGGQVVACVHLPEGRALALDPMARCHWTPLEECIDDVWGNDPEVWEVVAYDADGCMLDFY